ncbi:bro1 domain-containing protein brox [Anaeramoeba ignava]|uniref:Bro1 domain-containing protein brox n=1 Tax=Anaeramoeba ignava TaxID=1746090 RepID=A0A9Q0L5T3_ANAIG|nr:bro1 domain-containing protein brox [Anaeramoeba ignava]
MFDETESKPVNSINKLCLFSFESPYIKPIEMSELSYKLDKTSELAIDTINAQRNLMIDSLQKNFGTDEAKKELKVKFCWHTCLTSLYHTKTYSLTSEYSFEVIFVLLAYGMSIYQQATNTFNSIKSEASFEKNLNWLVKELTTASGVFYHLASEEMPKRFAEKTFPLSSPPEVNAQVCEALSVQALAEAEQLIVRRAINKGNSETVLSKLCRSIYQKWRRVYDLLQESKKFDFLHPFYTNYIKVSILLWNAKTKVYLASINYKDGKTGIAQAFIDSALDNLKEIKTPSKFNDSIKQLFEHVKAENERAVYFYQRIKKDNDALYFQKVIETKEMESLIPDGTSLVKILPFQTPKPEKLNFQIEKKDTCIIL